MDRHFISFIVSHCERDGVVSLSEMTVAFIAYCRLHKIDCPCIDDNDVLRYLLTIPGITINENNIIGYDLVWWPHTKVCQYCDTKYMYEKGCVDYTDDDLLLTFCGQKCFDEYFAEIYQSLSDDEGEYADY